MKVELRYFDEKVQVKPEERSVFGYGAVFNSPSHPLYDKEIGNFRESIDPEAFESVLSDPMILILANHNPNLILGRTGAGTAQVGVDERGLWYSATPPNSRADIIESVQRGDMIGSSFGFIVDQEDWSNGTKTALPERRIYKVSRILDTGPVSYAAYPDTSVASRNYRSYLESVKENSEELSNLYHYRIRLLKHSIII